MALRNPATRSLFRLRTPRIATRSWHTTIYRCRASRMFRKFAVRTYRQSMLFAEDFPVKTSAWLESVLAWLETEAGCSSSSFVSLLNSVPIGFSSRTSLASCHPTADGTWEPSSESWGNSGFGGPTECWTLNTSDWPKDASVCLLSQVLEAGPVLPKYYLSPKAARGILRRAAKRDRQLPPQLEAALQALASQCPEEAGKTIST
jgi:hypothetical protein